MIAVLEELSRDLEGYNGTTGRLKFPIKTLRFYKDYVSPNKPCILSGAIDNWPALRKWTPEYLSECLGNAQVPVAVTPDGRADAVTQLPGGSGQVFALPAEGSMTMAAFLQHLTEKPQDGNVLYMQQQNDCLRQEFASLLGDIDPAPSWAMQLFGAAPEAVNLWIGGQESKTSFHKDHYENIFAVIRGSKCFTLLPPADLYRLDIQQYPVAKYVVSEKDGSNVATCKLDLKLQQPLTSVQWSRVDPTNPATCKPLFSKPTLPAPLKVIVHAGEVLYLPCLWHHFVEQTPGPEGICVAVNFWFDMAFDAKYAYYTLVEKLAQQL